MEQRFAKSSYDEGVVSGYALKWGVESYIPQLRRKEVFRKGSLKLRSDGVPLDMQHLKGEVLGNSASGSLELKEDDKGLFFKCRLPESASKARELCARKDLQGASISFVPLKESNQNGTRVIESALVDSLSLVTRPAHKGTMHYRDKNKPKRKWGKILWTYPV